MKEFVRTIRWEEEGRHRHGETNVDDVEVVVDCLLRRLRTNSGQESALTIESVLSHNEFEECLRHTEMKYNETMEMIEKRREIREGNHIVKVAGTNQIRAQYGRMLPFAVTRIFRHALKITADDVFVDIGHGTGLLVIQAACMFGCRSYGVELMAKRNAEANKQKERITDAVRVNSRISDIMKKRIGSIKFVEGDFADNLEVRGWIRSTGGTVKMFCNNYGDNFGTKAQGRVSEETLDKKLATMFASTRPGTVLVTLHPLDDLPPSVEEWDVISRERATTDNEEKSFYSRKVMDLGEARDCVSWSAKGSIMRRLIL
jgi:hypothetical protein